MPSIVVPRLLPLSCVHNHRHSCRLCPASVAIVAIILCLQPPSPRHPASAVDGSGAATHARLIDNFETQA
uniref:Uncharacterized protein n=1 Tax=Leersia perrieri TaxID=77586 RepID=A0A0D9W784_9ORYZ